MHTVPLKSFMRSVARLQSFSTYCGRISWPPPPPNIRMSSCEHSRCIGFVQGSKTAALVPSKDSSSCCKACQKQPHKAKFTKKAE